MAHPFLKIFDVAIRKSSGDENILLKEAGKIIAKGYNTEEVCMVLSKLKSGLIDDREIMIVTEALEDLCDEE